MDHLAFRIQGVARVLEAVEEVDINVSLRDQLRQLKWNARVVCPLQDYNQVVAYEVVGTNFDLVRDILHEFAIALAPLL